MRAVGLLLIGALAGCGKADAVPAEPPPTTPTTVAPPEAPVAPVTTFNGVIASQVVFVVAAPFGAPLDQLEVSAGSHVNKGDVLAHLDDTKLRTEVKSAEADVKKGHFESAAAAALAHGAAVDAHSAKVMVNLQYGSTAAMAKAQAEVDSDVLKAGVGAATAEGAAANLEYLHHCLAQATLQAPFDAVVMRVLVKRGQSLQSDAQMIELHDPSHLLVRFAVPKAQRDQLEPGQRVAVQVEGVADPVGATVSLVQEQVQATMPITVVEAVLDPTTVAAGTIHLASQARVTLGV